MTFQFYHTLTPNKFTTELIRTHFKTQKQTNKQTNIQTKEQVQIWPYLRAQKQNNNNNNNKNNKRCFITSDKSENVPLVLQIAVLAIPVLISRKKI